MAVASLTPTEPAPTTLAGVGSSLFQLAYDLAAGCLWRSIFRLPFSLVACVGICLVVTLVVAWPALAAGLDGFGWLCLAAVGLFHVAAGIVWGVQRTLDRGAKDGLAILDLRLPELTDLLLAPLVRMGDGQVPRVEVAQVRAYVRQASEQLLIPQQDCRWWRFLQRLTSLITRWCLRAELAMVEGALAALERRGETQISLASLKNLVRDETLARGRTIALANLRQAELMVAAAVFALLLVPAALASLQF